MNATTTLTTEELKLKTMRAKLAHSFATAHIPWLSNKTPSIEPFMAYVSTQLKNAWAFASDKDSPYLVRKRKFSFGLWLAIWPVVAAAFLPSRLFAILHANLLSYDRLPVTLFCSVALISEAIAALLFFFTRRRYLDRPEDRLTFWSVIAAAAAGACALAFLAAAAVNAMHV